MPKFPLYCLPLLVLMSSVLAARPPATAKSGPHAEVVGFWRFEHDVKPEAHEPAAVPGKRAGGEACFFTDDVPGPFIYDPLLRLSYPNTASLSFQSDEKQNDALELAINSAKAGLPGQSVTLEFFFKPNAEWDGALAMKSRQNDSATEWGLEARYFEQQKQTYLHAFFTPPGGQTEHFRGGHYGASAQIRSEVPEWRHIAFVHDAAAKTLSCYIDYYQVKTVPLPGEMKWDAGSFYIGGGPGHSSFAGKIDELRLTKAALRPAQFLHARRDPIAGITLEGAETLLPRDSGYIDLKECFGALGDGRADDTAALREAFRVLSNQAPLSHYTLYIPPGTYLVSDTLQSGRSLTVQGAGPDKTIIKLRDKSPGFAKAAEPRPLWQVDNPANAPGQNGAAVEGSPGASAYDLTLDTGKGNAGAKGLEIHANFLRRLENVHIRSDDGAGATGLDLTPDANGTALLKNVRIKGFDCGVSCTAVGATTTFEQLTLEGQRVIGIRNTGGILAIHVLTSTNKVPALQSAGPGSMVTLLDSILKGGGKDETAVSSEGALYIGRLETAGYKTALRKKVPLDEKWKNWKEETVPGPKIAEYIADLVVTGHGALRTPLKLPIQNTPEVPWGDIHKDWENVQKFESKKLGEDWGPAIQAAIDSGAHTVYFPPGRYEVLTPVHVRGTVDRLLGLNSRIARASALAPDAPSVIFDQSNDKRVVSIERLEIEGLRHASPGTLVLKSTNPTHYDNTDGTGKLFLEDVAGSSFEINQPQTVWARQWDLEKHTVFIHGATLWALGFTTGGENCSIIADADAHTELLGGFARPSLLLEDHALFRNTNSHLSLVYGANADDAKLGAEIIDLVGTDNKRIDASSLKRVNNRARMDLYISDPTPPPAAER